MINHPLIKYAAAMILEENSLQAITDINKEYIHAAIQDGLNSFSLYPIENYENKHEISFAFSSEKSDAKKYYFLAPNIITTDMQASKMMKSATSYLQECCNSNDSFLSGSADMTLSQVPTCGEFCSFSGTIGRGKAKANKLEQGLGIVCSLTKYKPCLQFISKSGGKIKMDNFCIIPDLDINDMRVFYRVFKRILLTETCELLKGKVKADVTSSHTIYKPSRPKIFRGNFPSAPISSCLGSIGLLAAIGNFASKAEFSDEVKLTLESLKNKTIYLIKYGDANVFSYNNHIIDLAKESKLQNIVNGIYRSVLYNKGVRNSSNNNEYQTFDMFANRFLHFFNASSFMDFLSYRAEYPAQLELLFITYFNRMEKVSTIVIESAKSLGAWLNKTAFIVSDQNIAKDANNRDEELRNKKAKILVELESSIFAAKSGDALIAQTITRAGRMSGYDAPSESIPFIESVISGELDLNVAKNILIAFSRVKTYSQVSLQTNADEKKDDVLGSENEDYSNI